MYESHFGFRERPFRPTPDTACYYPATGHEQALTRLLDALQDDEGLALLTGEPGTGKTLLGHCLLERLGGDVTSVLLTNSHIPGRVSLLQSILYDLSLPYEGRGEQELRLSLTDHLLQNYSAGRRTVLVMDEAQNLNTEVLEELRLLANLEGRHARALQVVLLATPTFLEGLRRPELTALSQRLAVRGRVEPMPLDEAADYVLHRVRAAGGRPDAVLTDEAVELIARHGRGLPRLLNQAANESLKLAWRSGASTVDAEVVLEAVDRLGLGAESPSAEPGALLSLGDGGEEPDAPRDEDGDVGYRLFKVPRPA
jgi:type II secretory pathway predicted ATPase ExeA